MYLEAVTKIYNSGKNNEVLALNKVNLKLEMGKMYAIMGKSGSGKTTLINILGLLDNLTSGKYLFENEDVSKMTEKQKAKIRNKKIGFVFQSYYLDNNLTAFENVLLPSLKNKEFTSSQKKELAKSLLIKLGLDDRINHKPSELSGGEQQRVAIARALMNNPNYIIADEPTGNLDTKNEDVIFKMLKDISKMNKCVIVVTHNEKIKKYCDKLYTISDGGIS